MADNDPKLRVIDDDDEPGKGAEVVRLRHRKAPVPAKRPPIQAVPVESPQRLEAEKREGAGRPSQEPGVEAILEVESAPENIEQPWGEQDQRAANIPHGWFWLIGLLIVGAGVWAVRTMHQGEEQVDIQRASVIENVEDDAAESAIAMDLVDRVEEVVAGYLAADSVDEVLPWIRHPERVKPLIEAEWRDRPVAAGKFARLAAFQPATLDGRPFWVVRAEVRDGPPRDLLLEQTGETEVKVDWETDVCHQPMDWGRFAKELPAGESMDFRVWAVPDSHYSHEFSDSGRWRCFRLTAKESDAHLFGYVSAGSPLELDLTEYSRSAPNQVATVILRLRVPEGLEAPNGVVIEKVVAKRWIYLEEPEKNSP